MPDDPSFTQNYNDNERALCYHGPLIYEAVRLLGVCISLNDAFIDFWDETANKLQKILKAEVWNDPKKHNGQVGAHYFVHYKGWKQTWDEWVPESRLLKFNEQNLALQKQLNEAQRAKDRAEREALKAGNVDSALAAKASQLGAKSQSGALQNYVNSGVNAGARGTKRSRENVQEEEDWRNKPEIKIVIPDALKVKLVDDWEAITKNSQLIPLPRTPSVEAILDSYASSQSSRPASRAASLTTEVISGLKLYFEKSLGNNLLYKFERQQYAEMLKKYVAGTANGADGADKEESKTVTQIYGVEHLLRLFVNLPELIAHTSMDAETVTVLRESLQDILKYIVQEKDQLFNVKYEETSSAYQNLSRV